MNLSEQYKNPIRYEDINTEDKLIVSELIMHSGLENDVEYMLSEGDEVTVNNGIYTCPSGNLIDCNPCPCRGICISVKTDKHQYGSSCWYRFKTIDGRLVI